MLDEQWAFEAGMTLLTAAQAGVTLLHDIGYVASGTASSYESVVVMDELVGWVKAYLDGVTIDTEALAVEEIAAVGPGGTHLARKYTRRHVRDYVMPQLISQDQYDAWAAAGGSTLLERTAAEDRELRESDRAYRLDAGRAARSWTRLVEKGAAGAEEPEKREQRPRPGARGRPRRRSRSYRRPELLCYAYDATADAERPASPTSSCFPPRPTRSRASCASPPTPGCRSTRAAPARTSAAGRSPRAAGIVLSTAGHGRASSRSTRRTTAPPCSPGSSSSDLNDLAAEHGLMYPPDPGSVAVATMGGSIAECAGGLRGLKYGVTKHYVTGLEVVLADGRGACGSAARRVKNVPATTWSASSSAPRARWA